jgi:hypothetical protein
MHERLNPYRQQIALIAIFQGITVVIAYALGHLGVKMAIGSSGEEEGAPALASFLARHGVWLLLIPAAWTGIGLFKMQSVNSRFSMVAWLFPGAAVAIAIGFFGILAYGTGFGCGMRMS